MAARTKSKVTPKYKTKYRVRNWAAYEESLRRRGDITVSFDADAVDSWNAHPTGRPGGQREYSDVVGRCSQSRVRLVVQLYERLTAEVRRVWTENRGLYGR